MLDSHDLCPMFWNRSGRGLQEYSGRVLTSVIKVCCEWSEIEYVLEVDE